MFGIKKGVLIITICLLVLGFIAITPAFAKKDKSAEIAKLKQELKAEQPKIKLPIPTLKKKFSSIQIIEEGGQIQSISIPWIAEYIIAVYKYALIIGAVLAVLITIIGGFLYLFAGANPTLIQKAKSMIFGSLSGLILLLGAYLILHLINPELTNLKAITLKFVKAETGEFLTNQFQDKVKTPFSKGHIQCNPNLFKLSPEEVQNLKIKDLKNYQIRSDTGKPIKTKPVGNGINYPWRQIPFYEGDNGIFQRKGKYENPDLIIVHATAGTGFMAAIAYGGGPAVHYVIDRNGDIVQLIREENIAWSVKSGKHGGTDAAKRSIAFEMVNLQFVCGKKRFQSGKKSFRYSGDSAGHVNYSINKNIKFFKQGDKEKLERMRCQIFEPMSNEITVKKCECANLPNEKNVGKNFLKNNFKQQPNLLLGLQNDMIYQLFMQLLIILQQKIVQVGLQTKFVGTVNQELLGTLISKIKHTAILVLHLTGMNLSLLWQIITLLYLIIFQKTIQLTMCML